MPRESLDRKISNLKEDILILASMVELAVMQAMESLKKQDLELAHTVMGNDEKINQKRFDMENDIIMTLTPSLAMQNMIHSGQVETLLNSVPNIGPTIFKEVAQ